MTPDEMLQCCRAELKRMEREIDRLVSSNHRLSKKLYKMRVSRDQWRKVARGIGGIRVSKAAASNQ